MTSRAIAARDPRQMQCAAEIARDQRHQEKADEHGLLSGQEALFRAGADEPQRGDRRHAVKGRRREFGKDDSAPSQPILHETPICDYGYPSASTGTLVLQVLPMKAYFHLLRKDEPAQGRIGRSDQIETSSEL